MNVIVNGFWKHGTHAGVKACELLGVPAETSHWQWGDKMPKHTHHVFMKRDPRDGFVSWVRATRTKTEPRQGHIIATMREQIPQLHKYRRWLKEDGVFVCELKELRANDVQIKRLAEYLRVPYLEDAFAGIESPSPTWNLTQTNYLDFWTSPIEAVWQELGGPQILVEWGYG